MLLGWAAGVIELLFLPWKNALGPVQSPSFDLAAILSLVVCLIPITVGVRMTVESLPAQPGKSQILRQVGWPFVATAMAIVFGVFALYSQDVKDDFQITQNLMALAQKSTDAGTLPASLQGVQNWFPNGTGDYTLSWSEETDRLMWNKLGGTGAAPADRDTVIVVRFRNSFTVGCMFTLGKQIPVCANFEY
jgi:cytochrome bd-type quinol oxidase subunit 1